MMTKPTLFIALIITILLNASGVTGFAQSNSNDLPEKVDAYITETMHNLPIRGMAVAIVKGDQVLYMQGYGVANTSNDPVTPQTIFMLESVTKTFTALAIRQLAAAGKINLDAPVQAYIPEFRLADQEVSKEITVQQLVNHTSGISRNEGTAPYLNSPKTTFPEAMDQLARYQSQYQPGEQFEYSNWNYVLLGEIISRASGMSYAEYMQAKILNPLEMNQSSLADYYTLPEAATGNMISFGLPVPYDEKYLPLIVAAGGLNASAEDMTHYLIAFLNSGQYLENNVLPAEGKGWYGAYWNWQEGVPPSYVNDSFSGGHNAVNSNITLYSLYDIGVVVLMNAQLAEFLPGPSAYDISMNLVNMAAGLPYQSITNLTFYIDWVILDALLLLSIISIIWQGLHLKKWQNNYRTGSRERRMILWLGIVLDILICVGVVFLPKVAGSRWDIMLSHRPDFSIPFLAIGGLFLGVGITKVVISMGRGMKKLDPTLTLP